VQKDLPVVGHRDNSHLLVWVDIESVPVVSHQVIDPSSDRGPKDRCFGGVPRPPQFLRTGHALPSFRREVRNEPVVPVDPHGTKSPPVPSPRPASQRTRTTFPQSLPRVSLGASPCLFSGTRFSGSSNVPRRDRDVPRSAGGMEASPSTC